MGTPMSQRRIDGDAMMGGWAGTPAMMARGPGGWANGSTFTNTQYATPQLRNPRVSGSRLPSRASTPAGNAPNSSERALADELSDNLRRIHTAQVDLSRARAAAYDDEPSLPPRPVSRGGFAGEESFEYA